MNIWNDPLRRANLLGCVLVVLGLLGIPLGWLGLSGVPFLSLKPDSLAGGRYEPFAMELTLMMQTRDQEFLARRLTPEVWQKLGGPQIRTAAYARALTEAPRLPSEAWGWILSDELNRSRGRLASELGIPENALSVSLSLKSKTPGKPDTWLLEPNP